MIYTVTMNPALDISGTVDELIPDEKSYVHEEVITPGGNGINAAIIAHRLGSKVLATGFLGGSNGVEIERQLDQMKLTHEFVSIKGRTRMNVTVSNRKTHKQTRLSFMGPAISVGERKALISLLSEVNERDVVVFGGSLPPNFTPLHLNAIIKKIKQTGAKVIIDIPGEALKSVLSSKPYFIKPNLVEFQQMLSTKKSKIKDLIPLVRSLKLPLVCVSSVEGGAILVSESEAWYGKIPQIKIYSTVGAGDSMVGAITSLIHQNPEAKIDDLLRLGLASACATLGEKGLTLGSKKNIQRYQSKVILKRISS